jgi:hypothetical protein
MSLGEPGFNVPLRFVGTVVPNSQNGNSVQVLWTTNEQNVGTTVTVNGNSATVNSATGQILTVVTSIPNPQASACGSNLGIASINLVADAGNQVTLNMTSQTSPAIQFSADLSNIQLRGWLEVAAPAAPQPPSNCGMIDHCDHSLSVSCDQQPVVLEYQAPLQSGWQPAPSSYMSQGTYRVCEQAIAVGRVIAEACSTPTLSIPNCAVTPTGCFAIAPCGEGTMTVECAVSTPNLGTPHLYGSDPYSDPNGSYVELNPSLLTESFSGNNLTFNGNGYELDVYYDGRYLKACLDISDHGTVYHNCSTPFFVQQACGTSNGGGGGGGSWPPGGCHSGGKCYNTHS